jgi:hypothetical protein
MRGWADAAIEKLSAGQIVQICPKGNSMTGRIESGELVTLTPAINCKLEEDDVVLVRVRGNVYLHRIVAIDTINQKYQIGNNKGGINGWVGRDAIYGFCTSH